MSDENQKLPPESLDAAPQGAAVISKPSSEVVEPEDCDDAQLLERVEEVARTVAVTTVKHELHAGPMPAPKQLAEYDTILPGTALVIRNEFEANGRHVREMESQGLNAAIEGDKQNKHIAERLSWASLILILVLALTGHDNVAIAVAVTTVAAVITGFLSRKHLPNTNKKPDAEDAD